MDNTLTPMIGTRAVPRATLQMQLSKATVKAVDPVVTQSIQSIKKHSIKEFTMAPTAPSQEADR